MKKLENTYPANEGFRKKLTGSTGKSGVREQKKRKPALKGKISVQPDDSDRKKIIVKEYMQNIKERKKYAKLIFIMLVGWLVAILVLLFMNGIRMIEFSDTVLITLITTTTANITVFFLGECSTSSR